MADNNDRLDAFRSELNIALACGVLSDYELPVTSDEGECPVVVAFEDERLSVLLGRLRALGWFANVFVRGSEGVRIVSVIGNSCAIRSPDDVMTGDAAPGADATVGMFLDHLERNANGITLSTAVGQSACARDPRPVEFASV